MAGWTPVCGCCKGSGDMRLEILDRGHRLPSRLFQRVAALVFRQRVEDVVRTATHRPEFWGRPMLALCAEVLRGPSYWTAGEREYLAVFTSRLNQCPFCIAVHSETTRLESRGEVTLDGTMRPELAAVLPLLEKVSRTPDDLTAADVETVRVAGVPDDAIVDALYVNMIFNVVNRMGNAFGWRWDSEEHTKSGARAIHLFRYKLPGIVMR